MSRRIEIELTSARPDGTWTWRAAGAREPRGVLDGSVLHEGAKAGDVVRAEADFEIDGITITSVVAPKGKQREEPQRIELISPAGGDTPGVTTSLVGRAGRDRDRDRDRGPRREGDRGPRRDGDRPPGARGGVPERRDGGRGPRPDGGRGPRPDAARGPRSEGAAGAGRREAGDGSRVEQPGRPGGERSRQAGSPRREGGRDAAERARARRLNPGHTNRQAVVASLRPEEQAVAEQVLRGGLPAVRTALQMEREKATTEGRPVPDTDALMALAEELLPRLKAAEWRDRAEAAIKAGDDIALRDLRSVVAGSDVARDEESRVLSDQLRTALDAKVETQRTEWTGDLTKHLEEGRVVRALQLSGRPPDPSTRLPADLAARIAEVAGAAMSSDVNADRWLALLEAVASSPVRRSVQPAGLPVEPGADLLRAAHQQSGRVPALAAMLGVSMPPPPGPRRPPAPPRPRTAAGQARAAAGQAPPAVAPSAAVQDLPDGADGEQPTVAGDDDQPLAPPSVEPVAESVAEPSVESVAEPSVESVAEPSVESVAETSVEPVAEPRHPEPGPDGGDSPTAAAEDHV